MNIKLEIDSMRETKIILKIKFSAVWVIYLKKNVVLDVCSCEKIFVIFDSRKKMLYKGQTKNTNSKNTFNFLPE